MKRFRLNTLHRYVGLVIAPFLVLQALSGVLLDFARRHAGAPSGSGWREFLVAVHYGPGVLHHAYLVAIGAGVVWMALSGLLLYLRLRRTRRLAASGTLKRPKREEEP